MLVFRRFLLLITVVSAAVLYTRDGASILRSLKTINNEIQNVNNYLSNWGTDPGQCQPLAQAINQLNTDVNNLAQGCENDPAVLSDSDATAIINFINSQIVPNLQTMAKLFRAKAGAVSSVCRIDIKPYLQTLAQSFNRLLKALVVKFPASKNSDGQKAADAVQAAFQAS